jgi:arylsulfatase A-like enzyme
LAGESLRFTHAYPEAIPSIPARRGIHTGLRSFPFRGWELGNVTADDVVPTVLGQLGIEPPEPMQGRELSVLFDGNVPDSRPYLTAGYHDHARNRRHAMFARNDGAEAHLFDLEEGPMMNRDIAEANPDVVKRMWNDYVIKDAGGPLPRY